MTPKYIQFNYRNKERVWVRVEKIQNNYYYGCIDNIPISKTLKYKQYMRIHKNKIIEMT